MISIEPGMGGFDMPVVLQYVPQFDTPYYVVLGMSIACITSAIGLHVHLLFCMTFCFISVGVCLLELSVLYSYVCSFLGRRFGKE